MYLTNKFASAHGSNSHARNILSKPSLAFGAIVTSVLCWTLTASPAYTQQQSGNNINLQAQQQMQAAGGNQVILDLGPAATPKPTNHAMPRYMVGPDGNLVIIPAQSMQMQPYQPVQAAPHYLQGQYPIGLQANNQWHDPSARVAAVSNIPYQHQQRPVAQTIFAAQRPPQISQPSTPQPSGPNVVYRSPLFSSTVTGAEDGAGVNTQVRIPASYGGDTRTVTPYQPVTLPTYTMMGQQARIVQLSGPSTGQPSMVPTGQVIVPSDLQSSGPIIPPSVLPVASNTPIQLPTVPSASADPTLFDDLTLNRIPENGSLIGGIPDIDAESVDDFGSDGGNDGRLSIGIALNLSGAGAEIASNYDAIDSTYGASVDLGYKISDSFVGRVKISYDQIEIDAADISTSPSNVEGQIFSAYLLADWHPFENGFRMTAGPGTTLLKYDTVSSAESQFSPYVGIGYDSSLFSASKFGVWADIGATYYDDKVSGSDMDFFPSANLGVKYRF